MPLPRCYFDISINGIPTGRIVFELFADVCPKTCENFRSLCTGEKGEGKTTYKPLHYKATPIHRIVKGFIIQGGDFENGDGSGGESIYGGFFKDENLKLKHESPFLLSMANKGPNTNGSQYFITTRSAPHLDGVHVVFGRVVMGSEFVTEIENQKVNSKNRPYADIRVTNCGELVLLKRGKVVKPKKVKVVDTSDDSEGSTLDEDTIDSDSSSSEDSEAERRRRRRHKKKKRRSKKTSKGRSKHKQRKTKKRKRVSDSDSDTAKDEEADPVVTSTITEEDLPPEISSSSSRKSWLYRYSKSPSPVEGETKKKPKREDVVTRGTQGEQAVSGSGRILKGRGNMRYRTPPPPRNIPRSTYRDRYRQRSPDRDRYRQRSPDRDRYRQRSPDRDRYRQRSPDRDQYRQQSPDRDRYRQRSPDRDRYRQRSPDRERYHQRSPDKDRYCQQSPERDETQKKSEDNLHQIHNQAPDTDKDLLHKGSSNRDQYHERSPRDRYRERSPRDRYRERSPRDRYRERSPRDRQYERSSSNRDRYRERSPDGYRHLERSPDRNRHNERSPDRDRYRKRSPDRDRHHERSPDRDRYHENSYQKTQNGHRGESPKQVSQLSTAPLVVQRIDQPSQNTMDIEESSTPPLSPLKERMMPVNDEIEEDRTPPLYGDQTEYWSMEANRLVHEAYTTQAANMGTRWDKPPDGGISGSGQSDEDNELQTACEKVEQTLAEQQFGIGALINKHLK